ncbi:MAG TPA: hypothetical protein VMT30_09460 [Candidatus Saccharimonadia bacterium]|nr:hypothetical protein [Candidatus Saccharimonadia bacterium]
MGHSPATPQLDRALAVRDVSEQIGQFVMEHLAAQGIVLARWMWEQLPCTKTWGQKADGTYVEIKPFSRYAVDANGEIGRARYDEVEIDVFECPCPMQAREGGRPEHTYQHARWSLIQFYKSDSWINDELARFFGLDPSEMERERKALLASLSQHN